MKKQGRSLGKRNVLVYSQVKASQATVRRHYERWREQRGEPPCCDNTKCVFHTQPLLWNDQPLPLILDHVEGNNRDNRPEMLRYLCPNCDSQQVTQGGANKGRLRAWKEGFVITSREGRRSYTYFPSGGITLGGSAKVGRKVPETVG